jgi:hypothetical protein
MACKCGLDITTEPQVKALLVETEGGVSLLGGMNVTSTTDRQIHRYIDI